MPATNIYTQTACSEGPATVIPYQAWPVTLITSAVANHLRTCQLVHAVRHGCTPTGAHSAPGDD